MLLELWGAREVSRFEEYAQAFNAYYNIGAPVDEDQPPLRYSAANFPFHVIPELDTASHIETAASLSQPLKKAIIQRLRGCDPRMDGPTPLTLYYLARQANCIIETQGQANGPTMASLAFANVSVPLLRTNPANVPVGDPAGKARATLNLFDAFCDLMSYKGLPLAAGMFTRLSGTGARVDSANWAVLHQNGAIAEVQDNIRSLFWSMRGNSTLVRKTFDEAQKYANQDASLMSAELGDQWKLLTEFVFSRQRSLLS